MVFEVAGTKNGVQIVRWPSNVLSCVHETVGQLQGAALECGVARAVLECGVARNSVGVWH